MDHPFIGEEPAVSSKKSGKKRKRAQTAIEEATRVEESDQNDNSIDATNETEEVERAEPDERILSPYELLQRDNIAELDRLRKEQGILSHSEERKAWKKK